MLNSLLHCHTIRSPTTAEPKTRCTCSSSCVCCACAYVYVFVYVGTHVNAHTCVCLHVEAPKWHWVSSLTSLILFYFLVTWSLNWTQRSPASLASHLALAILSTSKSWDYRHPACLLNFYEGSGGLNSGPHVFGKHFIHWAISHSSGSSSSPDLEGFEYHLIIWYLLPQRTNLPPKSELRLSRIPAITSQH